MACRVCIVLALVAALVFACIPAPTAQAQPGDEIVFVCIQPTHSAPDSAPYLIGFRTTNVLGLILSENALITVYSLDESVAAAVHHIAPDAATGGYRYISEIATVHTRPNIPAPRPCENDYTNFSPEYKDFTLADYVSTIPLPVSDQQAIVIQHGGTTRLNAEILGAASLYFTPADFTGMRSFQFLQLDDQPVELVFPYITDETNFALFANKEIVVQRSFTIEDSKFLPQRFSSPLDIFVEELVRAEPEEPTLFPIMEQNSFRVYPAYGLVEIYPAGGVIRLAMGPDPAKRDPEFVADGTIRIIDLEGLIVRYYLEDLKPRTQAFGSVDSPGVMIPVVGVDEKGQLIVAQDGYDVAIESWWVEPAN